MLFTQSLKKNKQFQKVYNHKKSLANKYLILYTIENNDCSVNYLGISVSKKVGKSVVRNRVKRLIKESYRLMENKINSGHTLVVIARTTCKDATFQEISRALSHLLKKYSLYNAL